MKIVFLLLVCWSFVGQTTTQALSKKVLDFLTYITGVRGNKDQVDLKGNDYDFVQVNVQRVHVPALEPELTLLVEQATNGMVKALHLAVVNDEPGNIITMKLYNLTKFALDSKFGSFNLDTLSNVKCEQLYSDDECVSTFEIVGKAFLTGIYPFCTYADNGKHPFLVITLNCDYETIVFPPNKNRYQSSLPYVLRHEPNGQQEIDYPPGYESPCGY